MQQQQAAPGQQGTQGQQAVQQQGRALPHLPARRKAALAANQVLQLLLLLVMVQAVLLLPSRLQQLQQVGRGLLGHPVLVARCVILVVAVWCCRSCVQCTRA
jgi:hypothetical protein